MRRSSSRAGINFPDSGSTSIGGSPRTLDYVRKAGADVTALEAEREALAGRASAADANFPELYLDLHLLRRRIIFSHPALDFEQILINVNPPTTYSHNGDQFLARHSRADKGLTLLSDWKGERVQVEPILAGKLSPGAYRDPDLHFDADRVLFAFSDHTETRKERRRCFIYEASLDGSRVKQLTPRWSGKEDPGYEKMAALIEAYVQKTENENSNGWEPTIAQGAGETWVMEAREAFRAGVQK